MNAPSDSHFFSDPDGLPGFAAEGETFQHYQVLRRPDGSLWELGRGAMGVTYKAFDTNLRCHVALKVISAEYIHSETAGQRFVREARVAARVRHPNIATVHHLGVDPQGFFYVMEFIDGETLENLVDRVGPLGLETTLRVGHQVARALVAASRQGLIHRDIKPANLMVIHQDEDGEDRLFVKMIDFGLARSYGGDDSHPQLTATGFVGTPLYASPEQLEEQDLDVRSDIYSLGVTLWILLTGRPPFQGKMTQVITQHLQAPPPWWQLGETPEAVRTLLEKMLHKNRLERYQTAAELRAAIEGCLRVVTGREELPPDGSDPGIAAVLAPPVAGATGSPVGRLRKTVVATSPAVPARVRRFAGLRTPLVGVAVAALGAGGVVTWHGAEKTREAARSEAPAAAPQEVSPVSTAAAQTPLPTAAAPAEPTPAPQPLPEPVAETPPADDKRAADDNLAGIDGSPVSTPVAESTPTPAASPAVEDDHANTEDHAAATPAAKNASGGSSRSGRSHHSKAAPTPAPNFLQRLFGIKPKPKSR